MEACKNKIVCAQSQPKLSPKATRLNGSFKVSSLKTCFMGFSSTHLNRLLQQCSNSKALKQVHQQIIINGLGSDPFTSTKLIQMYADCNIFVYARNLFDILPEPNVFAWTAILAYYSRNSMYEECLNAYTDMKLWAVKPDQYIFPKVLRACAQCGFLKEGVCVHKDVIQLGGEFSPEVSNALIDMYSKCGEVMTARRVFDETAERDLLSWNTMISGYVSNGFCELAIELMELMRFKGIEPDLVTWNLVLDAYCRMGLCEEALRVFECIEEPSIISWTTLIKGYSRMSKHGMALRIFSDMMRRGVVWPDYDALSSIIASCRRLEAQWNGREIHGYGIKTQCVFEFYSSAGPALLTMYAGCGRVDFARNVFNLMDKSDVVTWNSMILGFAHLGMGDSALRCYSEMQLRKVNDDQITVSTLLPVCDLRSGKQIHAHIRKKGLNSSVLVWNALINMYSKCGYIDAAYAVFANMEIKDVVSWNTMISAYGMHGHGRTALQLLQVMYHSGIQPNLTTFTSVLAACSHSGLADEGLKLFNSLTTELGMTPVMEQFACVVDMLGRAGRLEEVVDFINKMPILPDKSIWGALLAACRAHQNVIVGKLAAEHLFCLEPENPGNFVTLSNIYTRAGRHDDAVAVRKLMEARGLVKPFGRSWTESAN